MQNEKPKAKLKLGNCLDILKTMPDNYVDSIVTDPPYLLDFMGKEWDNATIDPAFGHYIAGLVDGEGCFRIHKAHSGTSTTYTCEFGLKLRDDDSLILNQIYRILKIGRLTECKGEGNSKPQLKWSVTNIEDCKTLRSFFETFPLRAKKQKDFVHWSKHLDLWSAHTYGADKTAMQESYEEMKNVRAYENTKAPMNKDAFFHYLWAKECLRVLKPGGHMLAFSGTRTYHRMVQGIEDAGFEIRDQIQWIYGSGFPKSLNIQKAAIKEGLDITNIPEGLGSALKPANEPICLARKPLSESTIVKNVLKHGTGGLNIDGTRIEFANEQDKKLGQSSRPSKTSNANDYALNHGGLEGFDRSDRSHITGRFPANVIFDEEAAKVLDGQVGLDVSRFFYVAKASKSDRGEGNIHPTVKPIKLMEYLIKLITPPNGIVLDPFMGSGTTGVAAANLSVRFVGCEMSDEYFEIAKKRIENA